ncbi:MAG: hypothetical protein ACK4V1_04410, partial [Burkholderiaceae bacterium]
MTEQRISWARMKGNDSGADNGVQPTRRRLLAAAAALGGAAIAPGVTLVEIARAAKPGEPASAKVRWGLLIDANLCREGCQECVIACNRENGLEGGTRPVDVQWIRKVELKDRATGRKVGAPVMC